MELRSRRRMCTWSAAAHVGHEVTVMVKHTHQIFISCSHIKLSFSEGQRCREKKSPIWWHFTRVFITCTCVCKLQPTEAHNIWKETPVVRGRAAGFRKGLPQSPGWLRIVQVLQGFQRNLDKDRNTLKVNSRESAQLLMHLLLIKSHWMMGGAQRS